MDDEDVYEYKGGIHQRYRHIWYRIVNGKIVDSDQYRHDLEERTLPPEPRTCETCKTTCPDPGAPCSCFTPRSPQSADVETVREAEKSYCIERVGANLYWGGSPMTGKYKGLDALVSISAAIRFARKEDAEMVRASQGMSSDEYVVTEHQWL